MEQWKNLHQLISQTLPTTEESDISQINEKVKTDTLDMTSIVAATKGSVIPQINEKVKTDTLDITSIPTPEENKLEDQTITRDCSNLETIKKLPLSNTMVDENEDILSNTHRLEFDGKEKLYTKVMNETTLRIYCQKNSNAASITQDSSVFSNTQSHSNSQDKDTVEDTKELTLIQGFFCIIYLLYIIVLLR